MPPATVGLLKTTCDNLKYDVDRCDENCSFFVTPLFPSDGSDRPVADMLLKSNQWQAIIGLIDCSVLDGPLETCADAADKISAQINYMNYVGVYGVCLISPVSRNGVTQLAAIINASLARSYTHVKVFVKIRMDIGSPVRVSGSSLAEDNCYTDSWHQWNDMHLMLTLPSAKVFLALELGDLPDEMELMRWCGEPVRLLFLPTSCFTVNDKGYPVLSAGYQKFIASLIFCSSSYVSYVVTGDPLVLTMSEYLQYLIHVINGNKKEIEHVVRGTEDLIQHPLQPLRDNLEAAVYEVFERDPVKYEVYRSAILAALRDKRKEKGTDLVVLVVGAGRGPLVSATVLGAEDAEVKVTIYVVEKNINAQSTLTHMKDTNWSKSKAVVDVQIFQADMRNFVAPRKADIVVSELLGSFSDNELSPECLDGVYQSVHPDTISIPQEYTSHLQPVMSPKLVNNILALETGDEGRIRLLEGNYVVNMKNVFLPCTTMPVFRFDHTDLSLPPDQRDNRRFKSLTFKSEVDYVCHGFAGYFDTILYKKEHRLSIVPETHSKGMFSWFPIFFPLVNPIPVKAGQELTVNFWRRVSPTHVWYEFSVAQPFRQPIQNSAGRSVKIGL
jgi:protein arginine N-methyltransferase 5